MGFLEEMEGKLDLAPGQKAEVMRELVSHYHETKDELVASGLSETQADEEANKRIGAPEEVAACLGVVHESATLRSALLAAVPFAGAAVVMLVQLLAHSWVKTVPLVLFTVVMLAGTVRELRLGMRPIWLASWCAACIPAMGRLVHHLLTALGANGSVHRGYSIFSCVVMTLITVAVIWSKPKWRSATAVLGLMNMVFVIVTPSTTSQHLSVKLAVLTLAPALVESALLMLLALGVFYLHPYGSLARTMLFLATDFTLKLDAHVMTRFPLLPYAPITAMLIIAGIVVLFALSSKRIPKIILMLLTTVPSVLLITIVALATMGREIWEYGAGFGFFVLSGTPLIVVAILELLVPVAYDCLRRKQHKPPTIAI